MLTQPFYLRSQKRRIKSSSLIYNHTAINVWLARPGKWLTIYLVFTVVGFLVLPFKYEHLNVWGTTIYSLITWLFFYLGQYTNISSPAKRVAKFKYKVLFANRIALAIYSYTIIIIISLIYNLGYELNITSLISNIINPGSSYFNKFEIQNDLSGQRSYIAQIYTILQVLNLLVIPITFWWWQSLHPVTRFLAVCAILTKLLPGILTGTMVDIGLVATELLVSTIALAATDRLSHKITSHLWKISSISLFIFFMFAVNTLLDRMDTVNIKPWLSGQLRAYEPNNVLSYLIGGRIAYGILSLLSYTTHGYEGLGQCLQINFEWTFGLGHSRALMEYAEQYLRWEWIWDRHYLWRNQLATGRHPQIYWSTALPWIASDVSFYGVPFVVFFIGRAFGSIWRQVLERGNPIVLALFMRLVVLVLFLPANFQVFQSRPMWWGTMGIIVLWYIASKRENQQKALRKVAAANMRRDT